MSTPPDTSPPKPKFAAWAFKLFAFFYFILLACVVCYIYMFTQNRFLSIVSFKISQNSPSTGDVSFAQLALPGLSDTGSADSQIVIGFVNSTDLLVDLERKFSLREHYSKPSRDFIFRLSSNGPLEDRLEYYRKRIFAHYDKETGLSMLTVDTFDPQLSKKIAEYVIRRTETFVNQLNRSVAEQQLVFSREEVDRAEEQVKVATLDLLKLQNKHRVISPEAAITENWNRLQELRMEQLRLEKTLATIERDSPDSPRINQIRSELRSLNDLVDEESAKISGPEQDRLNQILAEFKELDLKLNFALRMRTAAETLLENHRVAALAQSRFISIIQNPYVPEDYTYPKRHYSSISIVVLALLLFSIIRVIYQAISEKV